MVVLANLYMAGLLSVPGCATTLYLAGLAICTWLRYNHYNPLYGWAGIWPWLCWYVCNPLPAWAGYLYLVVLATLYLAGLAIWPWLCYNPLPGWAGICCHPSTCLCFNPLPGWAGYLAMVGLLIYLTRLAFCSRLYYNSLPG
jgi:hypothetical protein